MDLDSLAHREANLRLLVAENKQLRERVSELEQVLDSLRSGGLDGFLGNEAEVFRMFSEDTPDDAFRILVEQMSEGAVTLSEEGTVLYSNLRFSEFVQVPLEEVIGASIMDFIIPRQHAAFQQFLHVAHKRQMREEFRVISREHSGSPALISGNPISKRNPTEETVCLIVSDLTSQKVHQQLEAESQRMATVLNAIDEPVILLRQDISWEYANRAAEELFAVIDSKRTLPPQLHELVDRVITESKDFFPEDYSTSFSVRAGTEVRAFLPTVTISSYSGQDDRWAVVLALHDVTELQLIDELKTDLVGTVSHELKTPITGMRMALMLLLEQETDKNSQNYRLAKVALEECERLLQTIVKLLEMTRVESREIEVNRESISAADIVSDALEEVTSMAGHRSVHLKKRFKSGIPIFPGDGELLRRVLVNLLSNAIKHSPSGGAVTVNASSSNKSVTFSVVDEGDGVPEKLLPMLFRRFYRVPGQSSEGSGLGLSIVKRYVEAHGGEVGAENRKERGARFWVRIPLKAE